MEENIKKAVFAANGFKVDIRYFISLYIANCGSFDQESQNLFNYFLFSQPKQTEKKDSPSEKEQLSVTISVPTVTETTKCPSCGVTLEKVGKFCYNCGIKLEGDATMQNEPGRILFGQAFYKSMTNLLYSPPGGKKSLLSIRVGASEVIKKCLFIITDSSNEFDLSRYTKALGEKAMIVTQKMFQHKSDRLEDSKQWQIFLESMVVYNLPLNQYHDLNRMDDILNRVKRKYNCKDQVLKVDEATVFCEIISEAVKIGIDFVCLDSLNGTFGDSRRLNRKTIRRILQTAKDNGVTLLCIHHTNKAGIIAGSSGISEEFDYICRLADDTTTSLTRNERRLLLTEEKARYSIPQSYHIKAVFNDGPNPKFELVYQEDYLGDNSSSNVPNLPNVVENILTAWESDTITFHELLRLVKDVMPKTVKGSVTNVLTDLSRKGIVQKTNGSWATILILRK